MTFPEDPTSVVTVGDTTRRTLTRGPLSGIGKLAGDLSVLLLHTRANTSTDVYRFIACLLLPFNIRLRVKPGSRNGYANFILYCPREGTIDPDRHYGEKERFSSSFVVPTACLSEHPFQNSIFDDLHEFTWNEVRSLMDPEFPEVPMDVGNAKNILSVIHQNFGTVQLPPDLELFVNAAKSRVEKLKSIRYVPNTNASSYASCLTTSHAALWDLGGHKQTSV